MATRNLTNKYFNLKETSSISSSNKEQEEEEEKKEEEEFHTIDINKPSWVTYSEQIQFDIELIKKELTSLEKVYQIRLKVNFDEDQVKEQEQEIEVKSNKITQLFKKCETNMKYIALKDSTTNTKLTKTEATIRFNAMRFAAIKLQEQNKRFHTLQKEFISLLKNQKEQEQPSSSSYYSEENEDHQEILNKFQNGEQLTLEEKEELDLIRDQSSWREKQILNLSKSVQDLVTMYNQLNILVLSQGEALDRIDICLEQTKERVQEGTKEVEAGEEYQKKTPTNKCILILVVIVLILFICLVVKYSL